MVGALAALVSNFSLCVDALGRWAAWGPGYPVACCGARPLGAVRRCTYGFLWRTHGRVYPLNGWYADYYVVSSPGWPSLWRNAAGLPGPPAVGAATVGFAAHLVPGARIRIPPLLARLQASGLSRTRRYGRLRGECTASPSPAPVAPQNVKKPGFGPASPNVK